MPRVRIVLIETFVLLGIVASSHHAFAKKPVASLCNNGRFITNAPPLVSSQVDIAGFFSLTLTPASSGKATLVVPGCTPITVKLQAGGKKSTNVKAKWQSCTGLGGKVQLTASIARGCNRVTGALSQKKAKPHRKPFTGHLTTCGDGILDPEDNELCDGAQGCSTGCSASCTCASTTGGTGAFGIITVNGKQKMYLPQPLPNTAGHGVVAVVNVGVAGNGTNGAPALITNIDLGTSDTATATGGDAGVVVAVSTDNRTIWFIDPRTDQLVSTMMLDGSFGTSSFSGGGGYVTGIAVDSLNRRAILSVWNGFILIDLKTMTVAGSIAAPPSENFGFDGQAERIIAPFYDCIDAGGPGTPPPCDLPQVPGGGTMTDGVLIIDLQNGNTIYTYQDASATFPSNPVGFEPDAAAADSSTGLIVVNEEAAGNHVIDLKQATFANGAVTAPQKVLTPSSRLTGVAIEPASHIAFFEGEFVGNVGFLQMTSLATVADAITEANMPALPDGSGFSNLGDPHGIAVTTGILNGQPVGLVVDNGFRWVGRVDLAKALTLPTSAAFVSDADIATAVTYLDAQTPAP